MVNIADTGLLLAVLDRKDAFHDWAKTEFRAHAPFVTCEAVLTELSYHTSPALCLELLARGDVKMGFSLADHWEPVLDLASKYRDVEMSLADACLVHMTELLPASKVWTVDRDDFSVYRRHRSQTVPCEFPPRA